MKADLIATLSHDGRQWMARGDGFEAAGATLPDLDAALTRQLRQGAQFPPGSQVTVFMGFDVDALPRWMRQYSAHYFNRYVRLQMER